MALRFVRVCVLALAVALCCAMNTAAGATAARHSVVMLRVSGAKAMPLDDTAVSSSTPLSTASSSSTADGESIASHQPETSTEQSEGTSATVTSEAPTPEQSQETQTTVLSPPSVNTTANVPVTVLPTGSGNDVTIGESVGTTNSDATHDTASSNNDVKVVPHSTPVAEKTTQQQEAGGDKTQPADTAASTVKHDTNESADHPISASSEGNVPKDSDEHSTAHAEGNKVATSPEGNAAAPTTDTQKVAPVPAANGATDAAAKRSEDATTTLPPTVPANASGLPRYADGGVTDGAAWVRCSLLLLLAAAVVCAVC